MSERFRNPRNEKIDSQGYDSGERECVWMRAKVVNFKLCDRDYDCAECHFDKAMKIAWKQENDD